MARGFSIPKFVRSDSGKGDVAWRLRYSARAKRVRIIVRPGDVEVVAPPGTPVRGRQGIEAFVRSKRAWIADSLRKVEARAAAARDAELRYVDGVRIPFRGDDAVLVLRLGEFEAIGIAIDGGADGDGGDGGAGHRIQVDVPFNLPDDERPAAVRDAVLRQLSQVALDDARQWVEHYGARLGRMPSDVRLGNQKTIWGSCAANGIVRINRRLIEAPPAAMEYVVAHEVAHLAERNHSPRFWATLGEIQPDWPDRKALLKAWEKRRAMEGWTVG